MVYAIDCDGDRIGCEIKGKLDSLRTIQTERIKPAKAAALESTILGKRGHESIIYLYRTGWSERIDMVIQTDIFQHHMIQIKITHSCCVQDKYAEPEQKQIIVVSFS